MQGFYIYLYGLGIFFLTYVYAAIIKDQKHKDDLRKQSLAVAAARGNGAVHSAAAHCPVMNQRCHSHESADSTPIVGSLFLRVAVVCEYILL